MKTATRQTASLFGFVLFVGALTGYVVWERQPTPIEVIPAVVEHDVPEGWIVGTVASVTDGDTLKVKAGERLVTIRLRGIDAPERAQAYGFEAKTLLETLAPAGCECDVSGHKTDRYGRVVSDVRVKGQWLAPQLVKAGAAWHYKDYSDDGELSALEIEARTDKRGLWKAERPKAPWDYRAERRAKAKGGDDA